MFLTKRAFRSFFSNVSVLLLCGTLATAMVISRLSGIAFAEDQVLEEQTKPPANKDIIQPPDCSSAIVMEASTGDIVYEYNSHQPLPPASMVKMMVALITMEKVDSGELSLKAKITTSANASRMGGSQVYLKQGEEFTLEELMKAVMIQSANDAAVAIAEYIGGSSKGFVDLMNQKASQLGMSDSKFYSPHGLPPGKGQEADLVSAYDMAILARALVTKHPMVLKWSSMEKSDFRNGEFIMTNTNRLVSKFPGCDGLKTGYYRKAGFCLTSTAERNGIRIIAVVMGCEKAKLRFNEAARLLSWGFNLFTKVSLAQKNSVIEQSIPVIKGVKIETLPVIDQDLSVVMRKQDKDKVMLKTAMVKSLDAPVDSGQPCGNVTYFLGEKEIGKVGLITSEKIEALGFFGRLMRWVGLK